jgi:predicted RNA-binding Zn-ribbon protein involved in translation (DUF1610 family)
MKSEVIQVDDDMEESNKKTEKRRNKREENTKMEEEKSKQEKIQLPKLTMEEEIRGKLLEAICPSCNRKDVSLEKGKRRECNNCNTLWIMNEKTGYFEREKNFQEKIFDGICPSCDGYFKEKDKGYERICERCGKMYILNENKFKEVEISFGSLSMRIEEHYEYDSLSLTFLYNSFREITKSSIENIFNRNNNLLIPTYCVIDENKDKEDALMKYGISKSTPYYRENEKYEFNENNEIFKEDKEIISNRTKMNIYLVHFKKKFNELETSEKIKKENEKRAKEERAMKEQEERERIIHEKEINKGESEIIHEKEINKGESEITHEKEINKGEKEITHEKEINKGESEMTCKEEEEKK